MYSLKGSDPAATATRHTGRRARVRLLLILALGFWTPLAMANVESSSSRVPLLVVEDLIKAGKFLEAESALAEWRQGGVPDPRVTELEGRLAASRKAASGLGLAEAQAQSLASQRASAAIAMSDESMGELLLPETDPVSLKSKEDQALESAAQLFSKGFVAEQSGDYAGAAQYYHKVLTLFPNSEDAQRRLVAVEAKIVEQNPQAGATSQENNRIVMEIAPLFDKGVTRFNDGDYSGARAAFQQVLEVVPNHPAAQEYVRQCANLEKATAAASTSVAAAAPSPKDQTSVLSSGLGDVFTDETFAPENAFDIQHVQAQVTWEDSEAKSSSGPPSSWTGAEADPWTSGNHIDGSLNEISFESPDTPRPYSADPFSEDWSQSAQRVAQADIQVPTESNLPVGADNLLPTTDACKVEELIRVGIEANRRGDILTATQMWERALQIDPNNQAAAAFLEKYANESADARYRQEESTRRNEVDIAVEKALDERTFAIEQRTPVNINEILGTMAAIADLQIITGEGVDGDIHALRTTELTYREFLDKVLAVNGYSWSREPGTNLITVTRDLVTKRFPLSDQQYQALKRLAMNALGGQETDDFSEALREVILGKSDAARQIDAQVPGRVFHLNKFMRELVVRDSRYNVDLVQQFLVLYAGGELTVEQPPLMVETFRLPVAGGEDMAKIINLRLFGEAEFKLDFNDQEPYLVYDTDSGVLIIRQTPEKLELVKRLMQDPQFVKTVLDRELKARKFIVVPAEDRRLDTPDAVLRRKKQVAFTEKVFRSLLYGTQSIEEAAAEGRVMYPDPDEGTIDIVDTPENLRKIDEYLIGVAETSSGLQRVVPVRYRSPNDILASLNGMVIATIPSIAFGGAAEGATGAAGAGIQGGGIGSGGFGGGFGGGGVGIGNLGGGFGGGGLGGIGGGLGGLGGGALGGLGGGALGGFGFFGILPVIVKADTISNTLTIMGFQTQTVDQAENLIKRLDISPDQVEVEVRLVELRYDSEDSLGVTMNINNILAIDDGSDSGPGLTTSGGSLVLDSQPNNPGGSSMTLATLGRTRVNAILTMLSQFTDLRILTAPKVTVVSGTPGSITLTEIFPYVDSIENVTQPGGVNQTTTQDVTFEEVEIGFTLDVTPTVTGDGHVDMQLAPVISTRGESIVIFDALGNPLQGPPVINEREATVRVRVNDGGTLVIGGLLRREINHAEGRTPPFGFIPGLAPLFTDKTDTEFTQNLLILVTARVIREG